MNMQKADAVSPESIYKVSIGTQFNRKIMRFFFRAVFHALGRVQIEGLDNVPAKGAYLIAMNHVSLFEPPLILAFWPKAPEAVGAVDIWSKRGQATLAKLYGGIPVHRGEYDRKLIETTLRALKSGRPLVIAPEGTRSHIPGMNRAQPGAAFIIDQANVPVIPVGLTGTTDDFLKLALKGKRPVLGIHIGAPIILPPVEGRGEARRVARQRNVDLIMLHIAALLPNEYRGVYSDANKFESKTPENNRETTGLKNPAGDHQTT